MESSSSSSSSDDIGQVSNKRSRKQGEEEADNNVLNERENKHISSATVTATAPEDIALPDASELFKSSISRTQKLYASSFFTLDNDVSDKKVYSDIKFMSEFKNAWQLSTGGSGRYQTKTVTAFKEKPVLAIKQNGEDIKSLSSSSNEDSINSQSTQIIKRQKVELGNKDVKETARIEELEKPISRALAVRREPVEEIEIDEHPNWELYRVISGHLGAVKSIAVDPTNKWFATGSQDHMIKIWDTATGGLMLTLAHHIHGVLGLSISSRHPYLFSAGEDKQVLCWDLTKNAVARHYHGHLSGVYSCAVHPTLDLLVTGGRDSSVRVWDMRTSRQVHLLGGHTNTVWSVITQGVNPQIISGSADSQVRLWDIVAGKAMNVLTHHKKGVRSVAMHPREYTFASASSDNTKKWLLPSGTFMTNFDKIENEIVNSIAINSQGVMARGGNNGMLRFYDYKSGKLYQSEKTIVQPGSLESEAGIHALAFDMTGSRLITCEADKTIKMWREESGNSS